MAESGGHWNDLAEAQKLTQTWLVPGVIEENVRRGGLLSLLPLAQAKGKDITYNRSNAERAAKFAAIGDVLTWEENITYTQRTIALATIYDQTPLNQYVMSVYGSINNYEAIQLGELRHGVIKKAEDALIYGDLTYGTNEFDGLHAFAEENTGDLDIDAAGALALSKLRALVDAMKYGVDFLLMPFEIARRIDNIATSGITTGSTNTQATAGVIIHSAPGDLGKRMTFFDGIPILRSDYMVAEQAGTGEGSDAKAKYTSGTKEYSVFAVKGGQVMRSEAGLTLAFGGEKNAPGEIFRVERFEKLEDYDASGLRLVSYLAMLNGSSMAVGRIHGITDVAITA